MSANPPLAASQMARITCVKNHTATADSAAVLLLLLVLVWWLLFAREPGIPRLSTQGALLCSGLGGCFQCKKKIKANDAKLSLIILPVTELNPEASNVLPNFEKVCSLHTHFS